MKYIITWEVGSVNADAKRIYVLSPEQINEYQNNGYRYRDRIYNLTIENIDYELVCAEIWEKGDVEHSVIIPFNLCLHRPYMLEVYMYAINLYSENHDMSQRAVAEATKREFKLLTFSHTTVGRVMKAMAGTLMQNYAKIKELAAPSSPGAVEAQMEIATDATLDAGEAVTEPVSINGGSERKKSVPSATGTKKRRELIRAFLKGRLHMQAREGFMKACRRVAEWWHAQFKKILI